MTSLSLTVIKKANWQACITRLEILRTKMQNFQNPNRKRLAADSDGEYFWTVNIIQ